MLVDTPNIPKCDARLNVSDDWCFITDPENERGEIATAMFDATDTSGSYVTPLGHGRFAETEYRTVEHSLVGFTVENSGAIQFFSRAAAIETFGAETVSDWEAAMDEAAQ